MHPEPHNAQLVRYDAAGNIVIFALRAQDVARQKEENVMLPARRSSVRSEVRSSPATYFDKLSMTPRGVSKHVVHFGENFSHLAREIISPIKNVSRKLAQTPEHFRSLVRALPKPTLPPRARAALRSGRFVVRFTVTFAILFTLLNAESFAEILRARLLPNADLPAKRALEAMTGEGTSVRSSLLAVPKLPVAGTSVSHILTKALRVSPPDNRLIIPELAKNVPLVEASDAALQRGDFKTFEEDIQHALRFGVVRYPGTAEPGDRGNVFVTGHSAYVFWDDGGFKEVFALLSKLEPGDTYAIYYSGKLYHYRVTKKFEVSPKDTSVLAQPLDRYMSTLMTCTPVGTNLRRLIVQAEEIDPKTGKAREVAVGASAKEEIRKSQTTGGQLPGWGNGLAM